jgi:hypothetical protein
VTCYRAGMTPDGSAWVVERSPLGIHPEVIATVLTAKDARAFIDSVEGRLVPTREAADVAPPASAASRVGPGAPVMGAGASDRTPLPR